MAKVSRRALARRDLIEIWTYIAADDEGAADRVLDRIDGVLTMLAGNPMAGRARPELMDQCRSFPVASYVLIYLPLPNGIDLLRVVSGFRDIDRIAFDS
ncbi:toxin ParE1/3/4 [Methylorubrum rhodinum]|uniref:Toxin ParE1/3/4 n=1 Tax=Methylorubrum rhodinum TaxID=29428 RepID=A0A840ZJ11_9HYPH|nr:type II toxin-antitoxin system RelE/ParE family toxin [Methylorubrum rhodinum]MBB5757556.1 toxin ParE1/3/4 [Methylorubrum rhodinum]